MRKELCFMSDLLNKTGVGVGNDIMIIPFSGASRRFELKRTQISFASKHYAQKSSACVKVLDSIQKEKFHFSLSLEKTIGRNSKKFQRYMLKSLCSLPFKLNGNLVYESFVEEGDTCEIGFHKIHFPYSKKNLIELNSCQINRKIVSSLIPILIEGETGTGKTHIAKKIHQESGRPGKFVHVNLCSFSPTLIESELFGHIKGAFTGAVNDKKGAFRDANYGTLFLDEIDSLNIEMQTKLLLFLEDLKVKPVGSQIEYKIDTRIICASGKNLKSIVETGYMRSDFYFRISSGEHISLSPLRKDPKKIEEIIYGYELKNKVAITKELTNFYKTLSWPGNIRQLIGHLDKKRALSSANKIYLDEQDSESLLNSNSFSKDQVAITLPLKEFKNEYIKRVFFESDENSSLAAMKLGISVRSLKRVIEGMNINLQHCMQSLTP